MQAMTVAIRTAALVALTLGAGACGSKEAPPAPECPPPAPAEAAADEAKPAGGAHLPPDYDAIPEGPLGDSIRRGALIFTDTPKHAGDYVGDSHSCVNCHLDAGRRADAGPLWAAWGMYPDYREKDHKMNTMEDRLRGCFTYSMNAQGSAKGEPPPYGDPILVDLQAYMRWLATGAPAATEMSGRGYPAPPKPEGGASKEDGAKVYAEKCALCHGENGEGKTLADGHVQFPPLWGANAYNWGAGMHRNNTAAGFIKANMPLSQGGTLSDKEAWDVAVFINSHERPKDPRQVGTVAEADAEFHAHDCSYGEGVGAGTPEGDAKGHG
ncbi:MAG: c-type cytochrome [Myxococcales bacterium]|nr:c-type cytochrome [Myxococcales bacterium]